MLGRVGSILIGPILFLTLGYSLIYVIGRPVIQFTTSSLNLFLLSDIPNFKQTTNEDSQLSANDSKEIASSKLKYPKPGEKYGKIVVTKIKMDEPLYFGDTSEILRKGAGQYTGSVYPGEMGTTMIGGHNISSFGKLIGVEDGDIIQIKTTYGRYRYKVSETKVYQYNDATIMERLDQRDHRKLILYTCYPIDALGMTTKRLFITADYVSGPIINPNK